MPKASKKSGVKTASTRGARSGAKAAKSARGASAERSRAGAAPRGRAAAQPSKIARGRPPKRVFINVLVRETTRAELTRLKGAWGIPSQGEVIDALVAEAGARKRG